jgi:hypothetical protein
MEKLEEVIRAEAVQLTTQAVHVGEAVLGPVAKLLRPLMSFAGEIETP